MLSKLLELFLCNRALVTQEIAIVVIIAIPRVKALHSSFVILILVLKGQVLQYVNLSGKSLLGRPPSTIALL